MSWLKKDPTPEKQAANDLDRRLQAQRLKRKRALRGLLEKLGEGSEENLLFITDELGQPRRGGH